MHLSAKMAHRFGRYFGTGAEYWGGLQLQFDLAVAARELACDLRTITPLGMGNSRRRPDFGRNGQMPSSEA